MAESSEGDPGRTNGRIAFADGDVVVKPPILSNPHGIHFAPREDAGRGMPWRQGWVVSPAIGAAGFAAILDGPTPIGVDEVAGDVGYAPTTTLVYGERVVRRWSRDIEGGSFTLHVAGEAIWVEREGDEPGEAVLVMLLDTHDASTGMPVTWPAILATEAARTRAVVAAATAYDPKKHPTAEVDGKGDDD